MVLLLTVAVSVKMPFVEFVVLPAPPLAVAPIAVPPVAAPGLVPTACDVEIPLFPEALLGFDPLIGPVADPVAPVWLEPDGFALLVGPEPVLPFAAQTWAPRKLKITAMKDALLTT
ncbi:MAG: hypothetical protein JO102_03490 [Elusimicrobia bacterium]|nr:hypothetical protein [Elusimicrobiota bacterium]